MAGTENDKGTGQLKMGKTGSLTQVGGMEALTGRESLRRSRGHIDQTLLTGEKTGPW